MNYEFEDRLREIEGLELFSGPHTEASGEMCVMEAASFVAGEPWSDSPNCVSPVIAKFLRNWNDSLPSNADRSRLLKPLIPEIIGTAGSRKLEHKRSWMALDWLVRVMTPAWLDLAGLAVEAEALRGLSEIRDQASLSAALGATDAARAAAGDAPGAAARDAARAAAWAAAWAAARDAAWAAAWAAAGDAARDAAWAAARDAAGAAAWAAAGDAARDAAGADLQATVAALQDLAVGLVKKMAATK